MPAYGKRFLRWSVALLLVGVGVALLAVDTGGRGVGVAVGIFLLIAAAVVAFFAPLTANLSRKQDAALSATVELNNTYVVPHWLRGPVGWAVRSRWAIPASLAGMLALYITYTAITSTVEPAAKVTTTGQFDAMPPVLPLVPVLLLVAWMWFGGRCADIALGRPYRRSTWFLADPADLLPEEANRLRTQTVPICSSTD